MPYTYLELVHNLLCDWLRAPRLYMETHPYNLPHTALPLIQVPITLESMIRENRHLITNEPVVFGKQLVEVQDCRKITYHCREIYRILKENRRMSTCNLLDLQTLGSQPVIMPKNLPEHWLEYIVLEAARAGSSTLKFMFSVG